MAPNSHKEKWSQRQIANRLQNFRVRFRFMGSAFGVLGLQVLKPLRVRGLGWGFDVGGLGCRVLIGLLNPKPKP